MLIDSHAHIHGKEYADEAAAVVARARAVGVDMIITVGGAGEMSSNTEALALATSCAEVYATVGMHPHDAKNLGDEQMNSLRSLTTSPKVVAIGETGLDYYYNHSPRATQRLVFHRFIHLARETGLPIVVHEREAASEVSELLRSEGGGNLQGVIHCFTGDYVAAARYLDLGFYLSFTGIITFNSAHALREVVRSVPLNRIMVETDSPYLTPVPHRGKRNEPAYVRFVAETIARIKDISLEQVANVTTNNARALFRLP
jgi:TatD DNase family protein